MLTNCTVITVYKYERCSLLRCMCLCVCVCSLDFRPGAAALCGSDRNITNTSNNRKPVGNCVFMFYTKAQRDANVWECVCLCKWNTVCWMENDF